MNSQNHTEAQVLTDLNLTERQVLAQLYQSSKGNGHDFGYSDDVDCVQPAQVPGYVTSLVKKGYVETLPGKMPMFELTEKGRAGWHCSDCGHDIPHTGGPCPGCQPVTIPAVNHEGIPEAVTMWQYRRYLEAVRTFMKMRAEMGESPSQTLGARNGAWAHHLMDRLLENADDPERCKRETERLEELIRQMRGE